MKLNTSGSGFPSSMCFCHTFVEGYWSQALRPMTAIWPSARS